VLGLEVAPHRVDTSQGELLIVDQRTVRPLRAEPLLEGESPGERLRGAKSHTHIKIVGVCVVASILELIAAVDEPSDADVEARARPSRERRRGPGYPSRPPTS